MTYDVGPRSERHPLPCLLVLLVASAVAAALVWQAGEALAVLPREPAPAEPGALSGDAAEANK